jgi:GNAT superfamily N-acetyltransferase
MAIRPRTEDDLEACVALAQLVHDLDGYPGHQPTDFRSFIASSDEDAAWVAERDGEVVGHVALHVRSRVDAVLAVATETLSVPLQRIGVVARMFVSPDFRRVGLGRSLLDVAAQHAIAGGRRPILDVVSHFHPAIALYEGCGWVRIGSVTTAVHLSGGGSTGRSQPGGQPPPTRQAAPVLNRGFGGTFDTRSPALGLRPQIQGSITVVDVVPDTLLAPS